ncbi:phosphonate metabolism transcriptional regulator PhnF [Niveibacterium umoris]|uniref:GntR family phosphonate transport system transcriptional regulator n=1 Tax=Niveibacterium umoris TaxID=1193620 RepID=A0A840BSU2_9RHOO|nr:phosphonate metabolism transcriptional regulator PhnF [Niveibacterium umoris]MBB4013886.1 GntR family phosphonate transport system transcriptional regulator [Niveibacterium umoris]
MKQGKSAGVERGSGIALWRQIEEALVADISAQRIKGRLPNELELAERFTVNRHTIRRAVQGLEGRGLVTIEQGRGTFVREDVIDYRLGRRTRFSHSLERQHLAGGSRVLNARHEAPAEDIRKALQLKPRAKVLHVEAHDMADGRVVGVCDQYYPLPRFDGFDQAYAGSATTAQALEAFGVQGFQRLLTRVSAHMPDAATAAALGQPRTRPVLRVESLYGDGGGQPVEYSVTRFSADAIQLVFDPANPDLA